MRLAILLPALFAFTVTACSSADGGETAADDGGETSPGDDSAVSTDDSDLEDSMPSEDSSAPSEDGSATKDTGTTGKDTGTAKDTGTTKDTGGGTPDTGAGGLDEARVFCVNEINKYRATLSLAPLSGWSSAGTCADGQSKTDSETGKAHSAFGKCGESAQNECPGWPGPPDTLLKGCLKMMWDEGPGADFSAHGHYINMSSTSYKSVACGFYKTPSGNYWAVQDFK